MKPQHVRSTVAIAIVSALACGAWAMLAGGPEPAGPIVMAAKDFKIDALTKKGPVFLYFIKHDCPVNARAEHFFNEMYEATKSKGNLVGIINVDQRGLAAWQRRNKAPFALVLDPDQTLVEAYRAQRSPWVIEVGKDGKAVHTWRGYSGDMLKEVLGKMADAAKVKPGAFSVDGAPDILSYG